MDNEDDEWVEVLKRSGLEGKHFEAKDLNYQEFYVPRLRIYPHALRDANAYYSPAKKALLFGYFPAAEAADDANYPGGLVFTCLSRKSKEKMVSSITD